MAGMRQTHPQLYSAIKGKIAIKQDEIVVDTDRHLAYIDLIETTNKEHDMTHVKKAFREHLDRAPWRSDASIEGALAAAINELAIAKPHVAKTLMAILDQRGCEHLDCGPNGDGRLTNAISVIVFG